MNTYLLAASLGLVGGVLLVTATRFSWAAWLMLVPLCAAVYATAPLAAGLCGFVFGVLATAPTYWGRYGFLPRSFVLMVAGAAGVGCAVAFGLAALVWPDGAPAWGVVVFPPAVLLPFALLERRGGRLANMLLPPLERWRPVVHLARLGPDFVVPAVPALAAAAVVAALAQRPLAGLSAAAAVAAAAVVAGLLLYGSASYRAAIRQAEASTRLRVAAVAVDGDDLPGPMSGPASRDVEGTVRRYAPHVAEAAASGARLIVLPEVAVTVDEAGRARWLEALSTWARQGRATVIAGLLSEDLPSNQLAIADETGAIAAIYDKQHPVPGAEPPRYTRMRTPLVSQDGAPVSAMICYDGDFTDLVPAVAETGGVLAVPSNDWRSFAEIHHRVAVWEAVETGTSVIRAAGHGTSSIYDPAGRVLARASSFDGPVVLIADVPAVVRRRAA